jgi:hypothetical protein
MQEFQGTTERHHISSSPLGGLTSAARSVLDESYLVGFANRKLVDVQGESYGGVRKFALIPKTLEDLEGLARAQSGEFAYLYLIPLRSKGSEQVVILPFVPSDDRLREDSKNLHEAIITSKGEAYTRKLLSLERAFQRYKRHSSSSVSSKRKQQLSKGLIPAVAVLTLLAATTGRNATPNVPPPAPFNPNTIKAKILNAFFKIDPEQKAKALSEISPKEFEMYCAVKDHVHYQNRLRIMIQELPETTFKNHEAKLLPLWKIFNDKVRSRYVKTNIRDSAYPSFYSPQSSEGNSLDSNPDTSDNLIGAASQSVEKLPGQVQAVVESVDSAGISKAVQQGKDYIADKALDEMKKQAAEKATDLIFTPSVALPLFGTILGALTIGTFLVRARIRAVKKIANRIFQGLGG